MGSELPNSLFHILIYFLSIFIIYPKSENCQIPYTYIYIYIYINHVISDIKVICHHTGINILAFEIESPKNSKWPPFCWYAIHEIFPIFYISFSTHI